MEIVNKNIDTLIFAEYNPRQPTEEQYQQLKDSITRFGLVDPIIVNQHQDRKNIIVGGHQRYNIAVELGIETLPCIEVDYDYDKEVETNIKLNKLGGKFDKDKLANWFDLDTLKEWGFKSIDFGFNLDKLPEKCECCGRQK